MRANFPEKPFPGPKHGIEYKIMLLTQELIGDECVPWCEKDPTLIHCQHLVSCTHSYTVIVSGFSGI